MSAIYKRDESKIFSRINVLRENMLDAVPSLSSERAVLATEFYKNNEKINLGKYPSFESLPTNSILYDVKVIPEIKNLHEWLITKYEDMFTFLNVKDLLIKDLSNTNDFESILKIIKRYNERIEIEIRNDDVIF